MPNTTFAPGFNPPWYRPKINAAHKPTWDEPLIAFMRCRKPMRLCEIANALGTESGNICKAIHHLEVKGVVRRVNKLFEFVGEKE